MKPPVLGVALLLCCLPACQSTSPTDAGPALEAIVLRWQAALDQNQYAVARRLSAGNAREFVDYLNSFPHADSAVSAPTELLQLHCAVQGDSALCSFYVEDEVGEKIPDTLLLRKFKGDWLVYEVERFEVIPLDTLQEGDTEILFPPGDTIGGEME